MKTIFCTVRPVNENHAVRAADQREYSCQRPRGSVCGSCHVTKLLLLLLLLRPLVTRQGRAGNTISLGVKKAVWRFLAEGGTVESLVEMQSMALLMFTSLVSHYNYETVTYSQIY